MSKDRRPVEVIQRIAAGKYKNFGMFLLNDENMTKVEVLVRKHRSDGTEDITEAIILEWLRVAKETTPRTYKHLIKSIRDCGLGALAEDIENALSGTTHI